jgi:glycosyltransferase involved in cell wall biosynthesis
MFSESPEITIIIKALNEESHIAGAIESAMAALEGLRGEIILADSLSSDCTVEIAAKYPIKIVSLAHDRDRSCGAGVQLGYQYSRGEYICLIDGDMRLHKRFLTRAIDFLEANSQYAGVGGIIVECETQNLEYVKRAAAQDVNLLPGDVSRLDCGGVYRRQAIEAVGYMGNRNVHAGEELELGARLRALGWKLARIPVVAIDHHGHAGNGYALLRRRWTTGFAFASGEILRATFGHRAFRLVLQKLRWELFLFACVYAWWLGLIAVPLFAGGPLAGTTTLAILAVLPFAGMAIRCRSVAVGVYSVTAWNVYAAGFWPGLLRPRIDPVRWIESTVIHDAVLGDGQNTAA